MAHKSPYLSLNNFSIGDKLAWFLYSYSIAFAFKCPILYFSIERWEIKTCFRSPIAILCFQMLIFYIRVCLILSVTQSFLCCLDNLRCWLKKILIFICPFVLMGALTWVKHKLNFTNYICYKYIYKQEFCEQFIFEMDLSYWSLGVVTLKNGRCLEERKLMNGVQSSSSPLEPYGSVFRGCQVAASVEKEAPLSSKS